MDRRLVADVLDECGTLLELKGESGFRANAYRNASRAIQQFEGDLDELVARNELTSVKGIGQAMAGHIRELVMTGTLEFYAQLRSEVPAGLLDMLRIQGFGPKKARQVWADLGIDNVDELRAAALDGRLADLKGFGKKSAEKILAGIEFLAKSGKRVLLPIAMELAIRIRDAIAGNQAVKRIEICGSVRRRKDTIKDIDILVASDNPVPIMQRFVEHADVMQITGHGETKSSVLLHNGVPADLRVVSEAEFPFALAYFTGSKEHNVRMRALAQEHDLKLNEYELAGPKRKVDCKDESDIFEALGLEYVPPELREDTGEIEAAASRTLPKLIQTDDITGVFHCHTNDSDGSATLEEMVAAAQAAGYKYWGIADHSQSAFYANGLKADRVRDQHRRIDALNAKLKDFRIYKGIESDILADGSLDYDEATLASFDYIVASVHSPLGMDEPTMTARICNAIRNPHCTMLGHPTGRLLLKRDAYPVDVEKVLQEAAKHNVMVEINANPNRLDLDWVFCKRAKALGVTLVINPDAHATDGFEDVQYGVYTAQRGWLEKSNVFNTRTPEQIAERLAKKRT